MICVAQQVQSSEYVYSFVLFIKAVFFWRWLRKTLIDAYNRMSLEACNRLELIQKYTSAENRDLGTLSPKRDVSIESHPSGLRELCRLGDRKIGSIH